MLRGDNKKYLRACISSSVSLIADKTHNRSSDLFSPG